MDTLIQNLRESLLNASTEKGDQLIERAINAILEVTDCSMCSLWSINSNNTNTNFRSASLWVRKLKKGLFAQFDSDENYVHDLDRCFIKHVLSQVKYTEKHYHYCDLEECKAHYRSPKTIDELNLQFFISIPIPNQDKTKNIALIKLSYTEEPKIENLDLFSTIIRDLISSCLFRHMLFNKQQVMEDLVKNYQEKGGKKNIGDIFYPIINTILRKYCDYEGASFFIWDSYMNHYKLSSTTGIEKIKNKFDYQNVSYQAGVGLTGKAADRKKSKIYDNLIREEQINPDYKQRFKEITAHPGKTMMVIPIFRPSKQDEVIGVLRFVNKRNRVEKKIVDYFNDADEEIISYASKYLALTIDYFLGEEERNDFISKLSHEFSSPANLIHISSDRLLKNNNFSFIKRYLTPYLEDIRDLSKLQLQQADTNLHVSKIRLNTPRSQKYKPKKYLLRDIIEQGKVTVIPFARMEGVRFDNIKIDNNFPDWELYVDKGAFVTVFYNLFTNAIKYRNPHRGFFIKINGESVGKNIIISIIDYGLGVNPRDKNKIFLMGYRGENVTEYNSDGFGIGLPVVKQIIEDFDGEICVAQTNNPTIFEIKLSEKLFNDNYIKDTTWNSVK